MATIRLGDIAPDFEAETSQGNIKFHEWIGDSWCILFSDIFCNNILYHLDINSPKLFSFRLENEVNASAKSLI